MKTPSITTLKKYVVAMSKIKAKYVTADRLSRVVGVYPEVINENLSYFNPMISMDPSFNLLELIPDIKKYISEVEDKKSPVVRSEAVTKKNLEEYDSITDFVYRKMSIGGIVDKNADLSEKDLRIMKKLISDELAKRKSKKK